MCQYNATCPTTRHRPGTVCPVEVRRENRERRAAAKLWGAVVALAFTAVSYGLVYLFVLR
jgi:hypothetical protein